MDQPGSAALNVQASDKASTDRRAQQLFEEDRLATFKRIDKLFLTLLYFEWLLATIIAVALSPQTWSGPQASIHFHVVEAFLFGGMLVSLPTLAVVQRSGQTLTRHLLAIAQMLMCGLLIQFTDGRIESHFSVFGALAFLAFYRDWKVLITASLVVALDHFFRGIFWPQSVFGTISASPWRTVEHTAWVVFEDLFLIPACLQSTQETYNIALRQALLEEANLAIQRDNAAKMRALVQGAVDGIVTFDRNGVIESLNRSFARMFGYSEREMLGKDASLLLDDKTNLETVIEDAIKTNAPLEIYMRPRTGPLLPVEISISEVFLNGRTFYTAIIRDISERKEVELRVSEFYSTVSHELRTPLTSIRGALGLIEGGVVGEVVPEVLELVAIARNCSDRLIRLINDILDLRKIEAGKIELRLAQTSLSEIIEKTVSGIMGYSAEKSVAVHTDVDIDCDMQVDSDRIIQVITNLLSNAIKFSDPDQTVDLIARRLDEDQIKISVVDHGIGMSEEELPKLFGKFQQLDSSDSRKTEGTGLGLAISKALIEMHGGTIEVHSTKGVGSQFSIILPLDPVRHREAQAREAQLRITQNKMHQMSATDSETDASEQNNATNDSKRDEPTQEEATQGEATQREATQGKATHGEATRGEAPHGEATQADASAPIRPKPSVLVIEDDDATRKIVGAQLRSIDIDCIEANNGASGMELVQQFAPDLIVLDLGLPQFDGFELVSMLRAEKVGNTALLVYTGRDLTRDERSMLSLGATKHLTKSTCSMNEFLEAVKELLAVKQQGASKTY